MFRFACSASRRSNIPLHTSKPSTDWHTFKVKTKNIDGVFSDRITSLSIRIHPPFWRTWWFYILIALIIFVIFYVIDRERLKRLRALQHVRAGITNKLHDNVSTTLNNVNILSHIAKLKASIGDIEKSKEFIDQIGKKKQHHGHCHGRHAVEY